MDIRTLPDQQRGLYNTLKKKYSLHFTSLKLGEHTIHLLKPSEIEEFLNGRDPFSDGAGFPFWTKLWEASVVLAQLVAVLPGGSGKRFLELGAGLGLPGLAASAAGFAAVLSDSQQVILDFQQVSAAANRSRNMEHVLFDWREPPQIGTFDIIGGAEILSTEEVLDPVLDICKNYLAPGGTIYLSHDVRRKCLPMFLKKAEYDFHIGSKKQSLRSNGSTVDILVNRLQPR
ncbi:MAG: methyltransferase [Desulfocapsaceae bacterium]|jgi:predicted nicotinamide N-methyase|nr:methyltransferase [Desulfocapsaceae bacterium]